MPNHPLLKKLIWLAGALLVGALGSGLWETALKPSLFWFGTLMLDVATLGLNSLRYGMYAEAAKGTDERAGLVAISVGIGLFCGLLTAPLLLRGLLKAKQQEHQSRIINALNSNWFLWAVPLALALFMFIQVFRVVYVTRAANYAEQLHRIVAPYLNPDERLTFSSRFAQIEGRGEYVKLATELRAVAQKNGAKTPEFDVY